MKNFGVNVDPSVCQKDQMVGMRSVAQRMIYQNNSVLGSEIKDNIVLTKNGDLFTIFTIFDEAGAVETQIFQALLSNDELLQFFFFPKTSSFEGTTLMHCDQNKNMLYCKSFSNDEIAEMSKVQPEHELMKLIEQTILAFQTKPEKPESEQVNSLNSAML